MAKATYKIFNSEQRKVTVDTFEALCVLKGIDPKKASKPKKRSLVPLQMDRISTAYPDKNVVAAWFKLTTLPEDSQVSSQESTIFYIERMYGIKAAVVDGRVVY